ncbi:MAG: peptidylprolyl isomerase [Rhodospirillales bacterium]
MLICTHINYAHSQETLNIAAVINDEVVSIYDLSQRINLVVLFSNLPNTPETHQRIAPSILRRLVIEKLHLQEAKRIGIEVPEAAIQNSISIIETSNNVPVGGMKSMLDSRGIDIETLRQQVHAELSWIDVIRSLFRRLVTVSAQEVDDVLDKIRTNAGKTEYLVAEIFLAYDEKPRSEVEQVAQRIYAQIGAGASWSQIAQNFSESASAKNGGALGWVLADDLGAVLSVVLPQLISGQASSPITTDDGVYILLIRNKRIASDIAASDAEVKIGIHQLHLALSDNANAQEVTETINKARTLAASTTTCPAFASIAKSEGSEISGFLGEFDLDKLNPQFKNKVQSLEVGGVSQPFRTADGVIVLMVCSRQSEGGVDPIAAARERIEREILNERLSRMASQHEDKLRRQAFIEIRL